MLLRDIILQFRLLTNGFFYIKYYTSRVGSRIYLPNLSILRRNTLEISSMSKIKKSSTLLDKILTGKFKIAVFGLGHVGAPLASVWLRVGAHVIGVDRSLKVVENAKAGKTHIPEPNVNEAFNAGLKDNRFTATEDLIHAGRVSHFKMICVPVLAADGSADLTAVREEGVYRDINIAVANELLWSPKLLI